MQDAAGAAASGYVSRHAQDDAATSRVTTQQHARYLAEIMHRRWNSVAQRHCAMLCNVYRAGSSPSRSGTTSSRSSRWSMPSASPRSGPHSGGALNDRTFNNDGCFDVRQPQAGTVDASEHKKLRAEVDQCLRCAVLTSANERMLSPTVPGGPQPTTAAHPVLLCTHRPLAGGRPLTGILQTITKLGGGQKSDWCW